MMPLLELSFATTQLGQQYFGPFNVQVHPGERIAILGPSGAGKSTLLKLMARELQPQAGKVVFAGRPLAQWPLAELALRRAVLPQASSVAFGLQCALVIGLGRVARLVDPQLEQIVQDAAALAHAAHLLGRRLDTLSGGEQARVQLARIFAQMWDVDNGLITSTNRWRRSIPACSSICSIACSSFAPRAATPSSPSCTISITPCWASSGCCWCARASWSPILPAMPAPFPPWPRCTASP